MLELERPPVGLRITDVEFDLAAEPVVDPGAVTGGTVGAAAAALAVALAAGDQRGATRAAHAQSCQATQHLTPAQHCTRLIIVGLWLVGCGLRCLLERLHANAVFAGSGGRAAIQAHRYRILTMR